MFIYREKIEELKRWKASDTRKPLIVRGARQVGKTELLKQFGRTEYEQTAYISFYQNKRMAALFEEDFDTERLIQGFKAETNIDIEPDSTLIILDEVQEVPNALAALKYFCEDAPEYHIVVAGSLLGVAAHKGISFPVGKVDYLELNPFSFCEFLLALGEDQLAKLITENPDPKLLSVFHDKLIYYVKTYFYIGGMPEVVKSYVEKKSWNEARRIQNNILNDYANDFSKHVPDAISRRITQVWDTLPAQLAKANTKKFMYGLISSGARAKEYELALVWLEDAGLIRRTNRTKTPRMPLKAYADPSAFKIYHLDIGLLSAMANLDERVLLEGDRVFIEFKGSLTEQFALQELSNLGSPEICYWATDDSRAEVEFIMQAGSKIVPVEIKSGTNLRSKSLSIYIEKYQPEIAIRSSLASYKQTGNLYDVPLYLLSGFMARVREPGSPYPPTSPTTTNRAAICYWSVNGGGYSVFNNTGEAVGYRYGATVTGLHGGANTVDIYCINYYEHSMASATTRLNVNIESAPPNPAPTIIGIGAVDIINDGARNVSLGVETDVAAICYWSLDNFVSQSVQFVDIHPDPNDFNYTSHITPRPQPGTTLYSRCVNANDTSKVSAISQTVATIIEANTGSYIQLVDASNCPASRRYMVDARDNHTYFVQKIGDLCWMETNLAYAGGGTNTYGDVTPAITRASATSAERLSPARRYDPGDGSLGYTVNPTRPSSSTGGSGQYGYLYNWCAAMNSQAAACQDTRFSQPNQSVNGGTSSTLYNICPKGWRLPTAGRDDTSTEFYTLNMAVNGGSEDSVTGLLNNWLLVFPGYKQNEEIGRIGEAAEFWSSTADSREGREGAVFIFRAHIQSGGYVNAGYSSYKETGTSIRCVAP